MRYFYLGTQASRDEYDRLIAEWLANGRRLPGHDQYAELSIAVLVEQYWEFAKGYYRHNGKPTKELACMRDALRPLNRYYGTTCVPAPTSFGKAYTR